MNSLSLNVKSVSQFSVKTVSIGTLFCGILLGYQVRMVGFSSFLLGLACLNQGIVQLQQKR